MKMLPSIKNTFKRNMYNDKEKSQLRAQSLPTKIPKLKASCGAGAHPSFLKVILPIESLTEKQNSTLDTRRGHY